MKIDYLLLFDPKEPHMSINRAKLEEISLNRCAFGKKSRDLDDIVSWIWKLEIDLLFLKEPFDFAYEPIMRP